MSTSVSAQTSTPTRGRAHRVVEGTAFSVIMALSFSHFLNDMMQSLVPALYPMLKGSYGLSFAQIGLITLIMQLTSSLLQPAVGFLSDHRPQPYSLAVGMGATLIGLLLLANAGSFQMLILAAALVGSGSAVFHPEASRVARMASGGRHGLAQSLFQVGGNVGSSLGPMLAAFIVIPKGQSSVAWFTSAALVAMMVLFGVGNWYRRERALPARRGGGHATERRQLSRRKVTWSVVILLAVVFSKSFYTASLNSYFTFYLISRFDVSVESAQFYLFAFLAAVAVGTLIGGPVGDRIGRKSILWISILGVLPFTLVLPLRRSVLDRHPVGCDRPDPGLGLLGDHRLCAGARAGKGRDRRGVVFWAFLRHGRGRGGGVGQARRRDEHRVRLPGLRLPAADRPVDRAAARSRPPAADCVTEERGRKYNRSSRRNPLHQIEGTETAAPILLLHRRPRGRTTSAASAVRSAKPAARLRLREHPALMLGDPRLGIRFSFKHAELLSDDGPGC